jgi:hypothetical protein
MPLVPDATIGQIANPQVQKGKSFWKRQCACVHRKRASYPATAEDIAVVTAMLVKRGLGVGLPAVMAQSVLDDLADCGTRVEIAQPQGDVVVITAEEATAALGHAF